MCILFKYLCYLSLIFQAIYITAFRQALPGVRAFHMSGKTEVESAMAFRREGVPMGLPGLDEWHIPQTSQQAVQAARAALDQPEQEEYKA